MIFQLNIRISERFHPNNRRGLELDQIVRVKATFDKDTNGELYRIQNWPGNDSGMCIEVGAPEIIGFQVLEN